MSVRSIASVDMNFVVPTSAGDKNRAAMNLVIAVGPRIKPTRQFLRPLSSALFAQPHSLTHSSQEALPHTRAIC